MPKKQKKPVKLTLEQKKANKKIYNAQEYQRRKIKKLENKITEFTGVNPLKKIEFEGKRRKIKTIVNILINRQIQANTLISKIYKKIKRVKKKKPKPKKHEIEVNDDLGLPDYLHAWDTKQLTNYFKMKVHKKIVNITTGENWDKLKDYNNALTSALKYLKQFISSEKMPVYYGTNIFYYISKQ